MRRISVNASVCPKCGEPLKGDWAKISQETDKKEIRSFNKKVFFWLIGVPFLIVFLPYTCSKLGEANAQERLPRTCWTESEPIPTSCEGEVSSGLYPFCPSEELYEQVKDMMPLQASNLGCESDVEGRLVKVLSCTYTSCKYSLYYGYDNWKTMWSQAGIVRK